jgi:hypothetical protein
LRWVLALMMAFSALGLAQDVRLPPTGALYDSQLGGAYDPPPGTSIVSRDREDDPALGLYNICYINAFQTQPQDSQWWQDHHPDLLLRHDGIPVEDVNWPGEFLLDTSTQAKRQALLPIVSQWIEQCSQNGFDAIEADNLDTYSRSGGALTMEDNLAFAQAFISIAQSFGLAAAQKNGVELGSRGRDAGFSFAITESCAVYDECGDYIDIYGPHVLDIEYTDTDQRHFADACSRYGDAISVILRDRNLTKPGDRAYVHAAC